jgi:DNA mismatch repair ATPase MutS
LSAWRRASSCAVPFDARSEAISPETSWVGGHDPRSRASAAAKRSLDEVQAVIDVIRASQSDRAHLFLFDELFRGTNVIERIAAGEAALRQLATTVHLVIAATHDVEVVAFLEGVYTSFHLVDCMEGDGLVFEYRLAKGPSTTRNAIALLELNGAPAALVRDARERAAHLSALRRNDASTTASREST